jgi:hypothetical protein
MISPRGGLVPKSRVVHAPTSAVTVSGASAVLRDFRPAALPAATTRRRGRLSLIATIGQEVLGVSGDQTSGKSDLANRGERLESAPPPSGRRASGEGGLDIQPERG